jgi:PAS domain S-box-containing protein
MLRIARYEVTEEVHAGARTLVYRAVRRSDGLRVVLKTTRTDAPTLEQFARWTHEHDILRRLSLASVPRVCELTLDGSRPVLVLEDVGGSSVRELLDAGPFELGDVLELALHVASALSDIHAERVIHKDINPSNLILNRSTGRAQIIDFGISSLLAREAPKTNHPNVLEGTLPYISPEQTGRMNRSIDYRTDFYSLGATLYELLTGTVPFASDDRLTLVHAHIAQSPEPPHERNAAVPRAVSEIVMKLLAKTAEERYQSANGLAEDLRRCLAEWKAGNGIAPFTLGERDRPDRLRIAQKIYGRDAETRTLLDAFGRVARGGRELMLVAGYSGIGKSVLVHELHRPITRQKGYFVSGKVDQYQKSVPYHALIQALSELVRYVLAESEEELARWKRTLLDALGANAGVITAVLPDLELIIGPQPPPRELPAAESLNRFNLVFQKLVRVFARKEHPLVIFLDDLQWADLPTLRVLELLVTDADMESLMVVGAYRHNQVGPAHPFMIVLEEIRKRGTAVRECALLPLTLQDLVQLVGDTVPGREEQVKELAALLLSKTHGNPFFVNQLLSSLYENGAIVLDATTGEWRWDRTELAKVTVTDNVGDLMASRIGTLPERTRRVLELAACMGNEFDLETLAIVNERAPVETGEDLWPALEEGLLLPVGNDYRVLEGVRLREQQGGKGSDQEIAAVAYRFVHDQIQQAAYSSIPSERRKEVHLAIGRRLLAHLSPEERSERIFDIVNQLDQGIALVEGAEERQSLLQLNLAAGKRARASAAYSTALGYLKAGISLLEEGSWDTHYDLSLQLHLEAAEAAYLSTDFSAVEGFTRTVLSRATSLLDKVRVYEVKILSLIAERKLIEAIQTGLSVLATLGVELPASPTMDDVVAEFGRTAESIGGRAPEALLELSPMTDPEKLAAMRLFAVVTSSAYQAAPGYLPLLVCRQVQLSVIHGNAPGSAFAYATYGLILSGALGDLEGGYRFGSLAIELQDRAPDPTWRARVLHIAYVFTRPWKEHVRTTLGPLIDAYQSGLETGDFEYGSYASLLHGYYSYFAGVELGRIADEMVAFGHQAAQMGQALTHRYFRIWRQAVESLLGRSPDPAVLAGDACDTATLDAVLADANDRTGAFFVHYNRMVLSHAFRRWDEAEASARLAEQHQDAVTALMANALVPFYDSLIALSRWALVSPEERQTLLDRVEKNQQKLAGFAVHAPMNFEHKRLLVEAERERVLGHPDRAMRLYDEAAKGARASDYVQDEGLACELAAGFYSSEIPLPRVAASYAADARACYARWGAVAKVRDLEERFADLFPRVPTGGGATSTSPPVTTEHFAGGALDVASVMKSCQALSQELVFDALARRLLEISVENAGANRALLLLEHEGRLRIFAEVRPGQSKAVSLPDTPDLDSPSENGTPHAPLSVIHYVARVREPLVESGDAPRDAFAGDPYLSEHRPRSLLCVPLLNQGTLVGVLYLENTLLRDAFTGDRLEVLRLLSSQMSISVTNARLYRDLAHVTDELRTQEGQLRQFLQAVPVGVFVVNARGEPYYANEMARELLGRGIDPDATPEHIAERYRAYVAGSDALYPTTEMPLLKALGGERCTVEDMEIRRPDRSIRLEVTGAPIRDDKGNVIYALAVFQDITAREQARRLLEDYNRTLEHEVAERTRAAESAQQSAETANQTKSTFLANMSHEIRTPLTALLGFADLLLDPNLDSSARLNYGMTIRRNGEHLLSLINDILDLSKIEAGKLSLERVECDLGEVLSDVSQLMGVRAHEKALDFDLCLLSGVPAIIHSDPTRIRQILLNLVGNAIKFTHHGCVRVLVRYETRAMPPLLTVDVVDTGIGIEPHHLRGLFQAFQQADSSMSRRFGGTGLGLTICRSLAQALGGDIAVRSVPGRGSTFTFTFPVEAPAGVALIETLPAPPSEAAAGGKPGEKLNGRVLLAEDGIDNQILVSTILRQRGLQVTTAENGLVAVEFAVTAAREGRPYEVILMDMQMPVLDGYQATAKLREQGYAGAIVALTAHAMAGERERCLTAGCDDYLSKPIDQRALVARLRQYLSPASTGNTTGKPAPSSSPHSRETGMQPLYSRLASDPGMEEIVARFARSLPQRAAELRAFTDQPDRSVLLRLSHQLKGAAGGYGFDSIGLAAERLEEALKKDTSDVAELIEELAKMCSRARPGRRETTAPSAEQS